MLEGKQGVGRCGYAAVLPPYGLSPFRSQGYRPAATNAGADK